MDHDPAPPLDEAGNVVPLRIAGELPLPFEELVEQALRIAVGLTALSVDVLAETVARTTGTAHPRAGATGAEAPDVPLLVGAALGAAVDVARWGARAATTVVRTGELALSPVTTSAPFQDAMRRLTEHLRRFDVRWREERGQEDEAAQAFVRLLVPQVVDAALDQLDLDAIVAQRVDVDRVVEHVDLNAVVERIDLEAIVASLDLDAIVERVDLQKVIDRIPIQDVIARVDLDEVVARVDLDRVVDRIDLNAVASRLDVDAVAGRLDVEAVVRRLDLAAIANEVIEELDLPEIIRESMGSMTNETVGGIRVQSMNADRAITRLVDRLLQRQRADEQERSD